VFQLLSRRERRILLRIERQIRAEDPELARYLRSHATNRRDVNPVLRLTAGVLALAAAVSLFLGAPPAAITLITFAAVLALMGYMPGARNPLPGTGPH
jgi:hypothetical protein